MRVPISIGVLVLLAACNKSTESAGTAPSAAPAASASASLSAAGHGRVYHYDLALTITEGTAKTLSSFSLDIAEDHHASARVGKNVVLGANARSDVGTIAKGSLTMDGDVPKLALEAEISGVDAAGKVFRASPKGAAATPIGKATPVIDATDGGRHIELTATPSVAPDIGAEAKLEGAATVDIVVTHTGGAAPTSTPLSLTLLGDAPAGASKTETKPLQIVDGGVASPRQDTGTRVKVKGERHSGGMALDFEIETSDVEPATPALRVRKITSSGRALVPWEKATPLATADEDANRYVVTVTVHHPK